MLASSHSLHHVAYQECVPNQPLKEIGHSLGSQPLVTGATRCAGCRRRVSPSNCCGTCLSPGNTPYVTLVSTPMRAERCASTVGPRLKRRPTASNQWLVSAGRIICVALATQRRRYARTAGLDSSADARGVRIDKIRQEEAAAIPHPTGFVQQRVRLGPQRRWGRHDGQR